jgi:hypothetical protein
MFDRIERFVEAYLPAFGGEYKSFQDFGCVRDNKHKLCSTMFLFNAAKNKRFQQYNSYGVGWHKERGEGTRREKVRRASGSIRKRCYLNFGASRV